ncbi:MAG: hypothetical protein WBP12_05315 [Candidatus Saccharimonas sp.]
MIRYLLLSLFLSTAIVFSSTPLVFAASDFDDVIVQGEPIVSCGSENSHDVTTSYIDLILGNNSTFDDAFDNALDEGTGWALTQFVNDSYRTVTLMVAPYNPGTIEANFGSNESNKYLRSDSALFTATIYCENDSSSAPLYVDYNIGASPRDLAQTYGDNSIRPIFINFPIAYPEGYAGVFPPDSLELVQIKRPDFSYDVAGKKIRLTDLSQPLDDPSDYKIYYQITIGEIEDPEGISLLTGYANPGGITEFDVGRYAHISIQATYAANNGDFLQDTDTIDYRDTIVSLEIDGSAFSGSTTGSTCDENDVCASVEQSPYEDCSIYGTDVFGFIGCMFGNFQKWVIWLIIPDVGRISAHLDQMSDKFKDSLGILWAPFDFIISTFQLFAGTVVNPTGTYCNIGNLSMFGSPAAPMEICRWRDQFPQLWSLMQGAIQAGLAIGFIFAAWNMFKVHILRMQRDDDDVSTASGVTVTRVRHK